MILINRCSGASAFMARPGPKQEKKRCWMDGEFRAGEKKLWNPLHHRRDEHLNPGLCHCLPTPGAGEGHFPRFENHSPASCTPLLGGSLWQHKNLSTIEAGLGGEVGAPKTCGPKQITLGVGRATKSTIVTKNDDVGRHAQQARGFTWLQSQINARQFPGKFPFTQIVWSNIETILWRKLYIVRCSAAHLDDEVEILEQVPLVRQANALDIPT